MRYVLTMTSMGLRQMTRDGMLLLLLIAPFLAGAVFRFGFPLLAIVLADTIDFHLPTWYPLADAMQIILAPSMLAMISAFVLLEERDLQLASFYAVTPGGKKNYLIARIGVPILCSGGIAVAVMALFRLSDISWDRILAGVMLSSLISGGLSVMIVAFAKNKVEGMAFSKLSGLAFLGLFINWLIPAPYAYLAAWLPSYWLGSLIKIGINPVNMTVGVCIALLWLLFFTRRYLKQVS